MNQQELEALPIANNVVLWQPDEDAPTSVLDVDGTMWMIGFYNGVLSRSAGI